jgi:hypothetical protein
VKTTAIFLDGGGYSRPETRLQRQLSLLTGKFTGNFLEFAASPSLVAPESPTLQADLAQFPNQNIRENISKSRELARCIRD